MIKKDIKVILPKDNPFVENLAGTLDLDRYDYKLDISLAASDIN